MTLESWLLFCAIWTAASLPFGPNAANCVVASLSNGLPRALWCVVGIALAGLCHMAAAGLGLSSLLLANAALFQVVKWLGVAYLAWLALGLLRHKAPAPALAPEERTAPFVLVRRAFLISMTNPKAILVYLAVFPQFLDAGAPLAPQLLVLVPSALAIGVLVYSAYCVLGRGVGRLLANARRRLLFHRAIGGFYLFSALGLASFEPRRS